LDWKTKEDITDAVLHQAHPSPPCVKIRVFLQYYEVPFSVSKKKGGGDYKKIPVLKAGGRQINDSYIIFKNLVPVLCGEPFNEEWQEKITYGLQFSLEAEAFATKGDMYKFVTKGAGIPACVACCLAPRIGMKFSNGIRKKHPNLPKSDDIGKEFAAAMGDKKFFGGEQPGQVDVAYYGTCLAFMYCGCTRAQEHMQVSGLEAWWQRMSALMPDSMSKKK